MKPLNGSLPAILASVSVVLLVIGGLPAANPAAPAADPHLGGEAEGVVKVGRLVYAGSKSSQCFSEHFLHRAAADSAIAADPALHSVKLGADELFNYPLVVMTGEGAFSLTDGERENLKRFVSRGGFVLASAGCSSKEWDRSFRQELARVFPDAPVRPLELTHPVFHTVYEITELTAKHGTPKPIEGISFKGRLGILYAEDGLNDTSHAKGCCCCGGNEILNSEKVNVNILAYSLLF